MKGIFGAVSAHPQNVPSSHPGKFYLMSQSLVKSSCEKNHCPIFFQVLKSEKATDEIPEEHSVENQAFHMDSRCLCKCPPLGKGRILDFSMPKPRITYYEYVIHDLNRDVQGLTFSFLSRYDFFVDRRSPWRGFEVK